MIRFSLQAAGWVSLYLVLARQMETDMLGQTLGGLCLAEALAVIMVAGFSQADEIAPFNWQDALEQMLVRWVSACVFFLGALIAGLLPLLAADPALLIGILGLALCLGALNLVCASRRSATGKTSKLAELRWGILAFIVFWSADLAKSDAQLTVWLCILIVLVTTALQCRGLRAMISLSHNLPARPLAETILTLVAAGVRVPDILIMPILLPPSAAGTYLAARGVAMVIEWLLKQLCRRSRREIRLALVRGGGAGFTKLAARLNLGMLLIGGGAAMGAISVSPYLAGVMGWSAHEFHQLLFWLVLVQVAPAIFGAADLLLEIAGYRRDVFLIRLVGILGFGAAAALLRPDGAVLLAQQSALLHLGLGFTMAGLLAWRAGIWPGLTGVFFGKIRLL
ncbi:hypothetical protein PVW51_01900 [Sulfitobacter sp. PR48]|uniref:hypothetical protein n=1 Tax=Sulfitobacter sp. PR48 TaxID=3028383 RepID=UPI00237AF031|nr:hypothetical protein [Sulfitobacter sp. PR48]MDD9719422.1 hypothetical protein [Sulfitobacter sp. PR48]